MLFSSAHRQPQHIHSFIQQIGTELLEFSGIQTKQRFDESKLKDE